MSALQYITIAQIVIFFTGFISWVLVVSGIVLINRRSAYFRRASFPAAVAMSIILALILTPVQYWLIDAVANRFTGSGLGYGIAVVGVTLALGAIVGPPAALSIARRWPGRVR